MVNNQCIQDHKGNFEGFFSQRWARSRRLLAALSFLIFATVVATPALPASEGGIEALRQSGKAFSSVAGVVSPSVVNIQTEGGGEASGPDQSPGALPFNHPFPFGEDFFERFFGERPQGLPRREEPRSRPQVIGQGSGFVFSPKAGMPRTRPTS